MFTYLFIVCMHVSVCMCVYLLILCGVQGLRRYFSLPTGPSHQPLFLYVR